MKNSCDIQFKSALRFNTISLLLASALRLPDCDCAPSDEGGLASDGRGLSGVSLLLRVVRCSPSPVSFGMPSRRLFPLSRSALAV